MITLISRCGQCEFQTRSRPDTTATATAAGTADGMAMVAHQREAAHRGVRFIIDMYEGEPR